MIVNEGKIIKIDSGSFRFERNSDTPGIVIVTDMETRPHPLGPPLKLQLPTEEFELEDFIKAYRRAAGAEVGYRETTVE